MTLNAYTGSALGLTMVVSLVCAASPASQAMQSTVGGDGGRGSAGHAEALPRGGAEPQSPWPMFRRDLKHTGYTPFTGPATPTVAWTFPATDGIVSSPSIGADGTIYFGGGWHYADATDRHLYALNPDGSLKWKYEMGGAFSSPALGEGEIIYISSLDGSLYAIQDMGPHGELKWSTPLAFGIGFSLSSPAISDDGAVYVGSPNFQFFSIDSADGSVNWSWRSRWCIISSPAIGDDGTIYVGSKDHYLYAFDPAIEGPKWGFPAGIFYDGHLVDSSPAIGRDGTVYFGTDPYGAAGQTPIPVDTSFWAVNSDGTLKWSFDTEDGVESSPALAPDGTIYFGSYDNHVYALRDAGTEGVLQWRFPTGGDVDASPTIDGDGVIYIGSRDGNLYALYPDGTVKWTAPIGFGTECSATIDDRGYLYIGGFDGNLYCFGTGAPDIGVVAANVPHRVVQNSTYIPTASVRNYRATEQECEVVAMIERGGAEVYSHTLQASIPGGGTSQVSFAAWDVGPDGNVEYVLTVSTVLPEDQNTDNDERTVETTSLGPLVLAAFATFENCYSDVDGGVAAGCDTFDFEPDGDVDLDDYAHLLDAMGGR